MKVILTRLLFILSTIGYSNFSYCVDYSALEWGRDNRLVEAEILKPLAEQFKKRPCEDSLDSYITTFFNELAKVRELISPQSYLLFREIAIAIRTEFYPLRMHVSCNALSHWELMELNIKAKSEMIANTLIITNLD